MDTFMKRFSSLPIHSLHLGWRIRPRRRPRSARRTRPACRGLISRSSCASIRPELKQERGKKQYNYLRTLVKSVEQKAKVIAKYRQHERDTGSPEVQVALLTTRIEHLTGHFKKYSKDFHSRRGLLKMVGQRRRLLDYLKKHSVDRYQKVIGDLGLRK